MSHYNPYPEYKSAETAWISRIPAHWQLFSFKRLATIRNGQDYKDVASLDGAYPVIGSGGPFARASSFLFDGKSVLLGRKGTIDRPLYVDGPFWAVDTMFYTEIQADAHPRYVYYTALNIPFSYYSTNTALPSMTQEALSSHRTAAPAHKEQAQIAAALDRETSRIDALIEKKTRFIELLKEKRRALITRAVMSGLDSNSRMKDSGVASIGKIPAHWKIEPLKYSVHSITQGHSPVAFTIPAGPREQGVLKLSAVNKGHFVREENKALIGEQKVISELSLAKGDVLITRGNTPELVADVALVVHDEPNLSISDLIFRVRVRTDRLLPEFLVYLLLTPQVRWQVRIDARGTSASMVKVGQGHILNWKIPVPPIAVQREIVSFLAKQEAVLAKLADRVENSIHLLKERRSALITAAVTGQIDLRGAA